MSHRLLLGRWRFQKIRPLLRPASRVPLDEWIAEQARQFSGLILNVGAGEDSRLYGDRVVAVDAFAPDPTVRADLASPLPFADEVFDGAVCSEVLEHVSDPRLLLAELARVLKPGSMILVTIPFMVHYHPDPNDYLRLTPPGLRNELVRSGFEVQMLGGFGGKGTTLELLLESVHPIAKIFVRVIVFLMRPVLKRQSVSCQWSDWTSNVVAIARRCEKAR